MTAITADNVEHFETKTIPLEGMQVDLPVAASTVIYKNSFVGYNAAGFLVSYIPYAQTATTAVGTPFVGIALEAVASQTLAGDATCRVQVSGYFEYALTAAVQLDIGKPVHAIDNATLSKVALNNGYVGNIIGFPSAANVLVDMGTPTSRSGLAGGILWKRCSVDLDGTVNTEVYLVHETENHGGLQLNTVYAIVTEVIAGDQAAPVITIGHTAGTGTTLQATLTGVDNGPVADLIQGAGTGIAADNATAANLIPVPVDVAVVAKLTTRTDDAGANTGIATVVASFIVL